MKRTAMRFQEHQLTEYRRHAPDCKLTKPSEMKCQCPIWAQGRLHGELFRRSLGTRSEKRAREIIQTLLDGQRTVTPDPVPASKPISDAIADYLRQCEQRLKPSTLISYRDTFEAFEAFCAERLFRTVEQLNLSLFEKFQAHRDVTAKTMAKEFQHLKSFCAYAVEHKWLETNLAGKIKLPKPDGVSTLPFQEAEAKAILAACDRLGECDNVRGGYASYSPDQIDEERRYARALVLTLLTTGLRISDTVNLQRSKIFTDGKGATRLRIRTEKTGVLVTLRLPEKTAYALNVLPRVSSELFFWKGGDERQFVTAYDRARRVIARLGELADVKDARPHRFRDTWAMTALLEGMPMRTVQLVLGHRSIRTTEEHYAPYVPEYQQMIDHATDTVADRLIT